MGFSLFKKRSRVDLIEATAIKTAFNIVNDLNNFTEVEQAKIVKRISTIFIQRFTDSYDEAYKTQQTILEAKELIK